MGVVWCVRGVGGVGVCVWCVGGVRGIGVWVWCVGGVEGVGVCVCCVWYVGGVGGVGVCGEGGCDGKGSENFNETKQMNPCLRALQLPRFYFLVRMAS